MPDRLRPAWSEAWDDGYEAGKRNERLVIVRYLKGEGADLYATLIDDGAHRPKPCDHAVCPEDRCNQEPLDGQEAP